VLNEKSEYLKYKNYNGSPDLKPYLVKYALGLITRGYWFDESFNKLVQKRTEKSAHDDITALKIDFLTEKLNEHFSELCSDEKLQHRLNERRLEQKSPQDMTFMSIIADGITKGELRDTMEPIKCCYTVDAKDKSIKILDDSILEKLISYVYDRTAKYFSDKDLDIFTVRSLTEQICQTILYYKCYKEYANVKGELLFVKSVYNTWCNLYAYREKIKDKKMLDNFLESLHISKIININNFLLLKIDSDALEEKAKEHKPPNFGDDEEEKKAKNTRDKNITKIKKNLQEVLTECL